MNPPRLPLDAPASKVSAKAWLTRCREALHRCDEFPAVTAHQQARQALAVTTAVHR